MIVLPHIVAVSTISVLLASATPSRYPDITHRNNDWPAQIDCCGLCKQAPKHLANLTVNLAEDVSAGTTLNFTDVGSFIPSAIGVGPFCRFSGNITTSNTSSVRFEVWLPPKQKWNGHHLMVGNGGSNGFVRYDVMGVPVDKYGFAVASTNNGHDGGLTDMTFALQNPESQEDFGYRATHLTTAYSKKIVDLYYGDKPGLSYFAGCSAGGRQGLKELQDYPEDYDAALIGAPAWNWAKQLGYSYYLNALVNPVNTTRHIPLTSWSSIYTEVLAQCDGQDGLVDGLLVRPGECNVDYTRVTCGSSSDLFNSTTCLTDEQVGTLRKIYTDWKDPRTGEVIFQGYEIAAAVLSGATIPGRPSGSGPGYFNYFVQNVTELVQPLLAPPISVDGQPINETQLIDLINKAQTENPGGVVVTETNLTDFFQRGGKLLHYMGGADPLVPTNSSLDYYGKVNQTSPEYVDESYLYYEIPGMSHCGGGPGTGNFGQADQVTMAAGGAYQSSSFDAAHDALLALREWRERGDRPGAIIAAKFAGDDIRNGTAFERPICPWPQSSRYSGGDVDNASTFRCE